MTELQKMLKETFLQMVAKHGNGRWAYEELEWWLYERDKDWYNSFNEDQKHELESYMISFRNFYK